MKDPPTSDAEAGGYFPATRWSLVMASQDGGDERRAREALAELCRLYWPAVFMYVRARGHSEHDAQDMAQGIFLRLLESESLASVRQEKGRLRTFLLVVARRFLANDWEHRNTQKRGGGAFTISLEEMPSAPPDPGLSPEAAFDRQWALSLLGRTLARLEKEYADSGKGALFSVLEPVLTLEPGQTPCAELAQKLDMGEGALRVAVHRLRRRYRELLHREIAETTISPEAAAEEMHDLRAALGGGGQAEKSPLPR